MSGQINLGRLRCKEVISITDGCRIGYVDDIEIDTDTGKVVSVIVPSHRKFLFFFSRTVYSIPWDSIRKVGDETVLVEWNTPEPEKRNDIFSLRGVKK